VEYTHEFYHPDDPDDSSDSDAAGRNAQDLSVPDNREIRPENEASARRAPAFCSRNHFTIAHHQLCSRVMCTLGTQNFILKLPLTSILRGNKYLSPSNESNTIFSPPPDYTTRGYDEPHPMDTSPQHEGQNNNAGQAGSRFFGNQSGMQKSNLRFSTSNMNRSKPEQFFEKMDRRFRALETLTVSEKVEAKKHKSEEDNFKC
jgi:hypothetical protein